MLICSYWCHPLLYLGVSAGFDTHVEACRVSRGGLCVRPKVDNDGSSRVEPLQAALRAAQVDLLHVSAMRLVAQATDEEKTDFLFTLSAS